MTLDPDAWSMLCKIDGDRSVAELARDCGYTLFEAGHVIVSLVRAGLVDIEEDLDSEPDDDSPRSRVQRRTEEFPGPVSGRRQGCRSAWAATSTGTAS